MGKRSYHVLPPDDWGGQKPLPVMLHFHGWARQGGFDCASGDDIAALMAIPGKLPRDASCSEALREVLHLHGLDDTVMDFPFGPDGDADSPVVLWRDRLGCTTEPVSAAETWSANPWMTLTRRIWDCPEGTVHLNTQPGGHLIPHVWIARQLDEIFGLPFSDTQGLSGFAQTDNHVH